MTKPIFSGKLYVQSLKKVRTLGIAVLIAVVLLNMFMPIMGIIEDINKDRRYEEDIVYYENKLGLLGTIVSPDDYKPEVQTMDDWEFAPFLWSTGVFAPLLVYAMFFFLNERKQSDFYHSLPQTRACVYLSMTAAIFTWLLGVILVSVGINALLWSFAKYTVFTFTTVWANIALYFALGVFMSAFLAVAMMITGTTISNLLIYVFLMVFPRYVVAMFLGSLDEAISILPNVMDYCSILSFERWLPICWTMGDVTYDGYLIDPGMLWYSVIVGLLLFALAGVLYHFRRSESAMRSAPNYLAQHIYRTLFTVAMAITIPYAICMDGFNEIVILLVFLTIVVHVLYELLTTKKIKQMVKTLPLLVIPFVVAAIFGGSVWCVSSYVYSVRPEAEDVTAVSFAKQYSYVYGEYAMYDKKLTDENTIELAVKSLHKELDEVERPYDESWEWRTVSYTLKSGRTIHRYIRVTTSDWQEICMSAETREIYLSLPADDVIASFAIQPLPGVYRYESTIDLEYTKESASLYAADPVEKVLAGSRDLAVVQKAIWAVFKEEYESLSDEKKMELLNFTLDHKRADTFYIEVRIFENPKQSRLTRYFYYQLLPEYTPKTIDFIMSLYGGEHTIIGALRQMESENLDEYVDVFVKNGGVYQRFYVSIKDFFANVTLDETLFDDDGYDVLVNFYHNGYAFWLNISKEELESTLATYGNIQLSK